MSDQPLLDSAAADFVELYDRTLDDVYSYLRSRLGDRSLAEDLTQEVFLAGVRRVASGLPVELGWLIAVARNKAVDHWRREARRGRRLRLVESAAAPDADQVDDPMDVTRADEVLAGLNPTYRTALVLRHVDRLPVPEVAEHLGRTVAATEQVLSRARAAFRRAYQEQADD
jgi:RNA polymerase sigma-70 factor (ECF subfamily)